MFTWPECDVHVGLVVHVQVDPQPAAARWRFPVVPGAVAPDEPDSPGCLHTGDAEPVALPVQGVADFGITSGGHGQPGYRAETCAVLAGRLGRGHRPIRPRRVSTAEPVIVIRCPDDCVMVVPAVLTLDRVTGHISRHRSVVEEGQPIAAGGRYRLAVGPVDPSDCVVPRPRHRAPRDEDLAASGGRADGWRVGLGQHGGSGSDTCNDDCCQQQRERAQADCLAHGFSSSCVGPIANLPLRNEIIPASGRRCGRPEYDWVRSCLAAHLTSFPDHVSRGRVRWVARHRFPCN